MDKEMLFKMWESEFWDPYSDDEIMQDQYFTGVAIGFFIAKGCTPSEALEVYNYCIKKGKF